MGKPLPTFEGETVIVVCNYYKILGVHFQTRGVAVDLAGLKFTVVTGKKIGRPPDRPDKRMDLQTRGPGCMDNFPLLVYFFPPVVL